MKKPEHLYYPVPGLGDGKIESELLLKLVRVVTKKVGRQNVEY